MRKKLLVYMLMVHQVVYKCLFNPLILHSSNLKLIKGTGKTMTVTHVLDSLKVK